MFRAPSAPVLGVACGTHSLKNVRRVIRIPNMCLVLKSDNGKVVSIANGQERSPIEGERSVSATVIGEKTPEKKPHGEKLG